MAKAPIPGECKTRLAADIGVDSAATIARHMLCTTVANAVAAAKLSSSDVRVEIHGVQAFDHPAWPSEVAEANLGMFLQHGDTLGERMWNAINAEHRQLEHDLSGRPGTKPPADREATAATLIGTDCPGLTASILAEHQQQLATHDAAIIPARDGGYVALSMRNFCVDVFRGIPWSTDVVCAQTLDRLHDLGLKVAIGPTLVDVDTQADLESYQHLMP